MEEHCIFHPMLLVQGVSVTNGFGRDFFYELKLDKANCTEFALGALDTQ